MKKIYVLIALCYFQYQALAQTETSLFNKEKWSVDLEAGKVFPIKNSFAQTTGSNFLVMGLDFFYFNYSFNRFNFTLNTGFNYGEKFYDNIYPDIAFEGGYVGSFKALKKRYGLWAGFTAGYQPFSFLELKVPIGLSLRAIQNTGEFYMYDGQEINEADLVSETEAYGSNNTYIGGNLGLGIRTGAELIVFPNFLFSVFGKVNYQTYGNKSIWDLESGRLNMETGDMDFNTTSVNNTSEWGFQIGVRINLKGGDPKEPKRQGTSKRRKTTNKPTTNPPKEDTENKDVKLEPKTGRK